KRWPIGSLLSWIRTSSAPASARPPGARFATATTSMPSVPVSSRSSIDSAGGPLDEGERQEDSPSPPFVVSPAQALDGISLPGRLERSRCPPGRSTLHFCTLGPARNRRRSRRLLPRTNRRSRIRARLCHLLERSRRCQSPPCSQAVPSGFPEIEPGARLRL